MKKSLPSTQELIRIASELSAEKFRAGIDGMSAAECLNNILFNADKIVSDISCGTYRPKPAIKVAGTKRSSKAALICRLTALDTVVQRVAAQKLRSFYEPICSDFSFAFIPINGRRAAIKQYTDYANSCENVIIIEVKSCCESIEHDLLAKKIRKSTGDDAFTDFIATLVKTPLATENGIAPNKRGLMPDAPVSPILQEFFLNSLDLFIEKCGFAFCRYDAVTAVFLPAGSDSEACANRITNFLSNELHLSTDYDKITIASPENSEFLGYRFMRNGENKICVAESFDNCTSFYNNWTLESGKRMHKKIDILSDGILSKKDFSLLFEGEKQTSIPIKAVNYINIYSSVTLAPQAIKIAAENGVTINCFDEFGHLLGRFEPFREFRDVSLALLQLDAYNHRKTTRTVWARNILLSSMHNIRLNIRYYKKQTDSDKCIDTLQKYVKIEKEIKNCQSIDSLLMLEARMRELYYSCFNEFIKADNFKFCKRTKRPPMDEINALISFGNTFLYNYIAMEINKTPLDIRIGFLHSTTKRRESLNLDIADIYKPLIVDRTIFSVINKHMILKDKHFEKMNNGAIYLNKDGKRIFLDALYDKLDTELTIDDEKQNYRQIITKDIRTMCASLRSKKPYKGYRQVR